MAYDFSGDSARRAREAFERVLDGALPAYELGQLKLFQDDDEDFIKKEVERKLYTIQLPNAGQRERRMIERFKKLARDRDWADSWRAAQCARTWEALLPRDPRHAGRYYIRHPLAARTNKDDYKWYSDLMRIAEGSRQWERKWFAEQMLEGMPEPVSNFDLECLYLLKCADGNMDRLVRLRNVMGETSGIVRLDAKAFHAPEKFREWCLNQGNFDWSAGVKELQKLHEDVSHSAAWRVVNEVVTFGWLPLNEKHGVGEVKFEGIWFFGDCAYADGKLIQPDEDGIYWWNGEGYKVSDQGRENAFCQKRPLLLPDVKTENVKVSLGENKAVCHPKLMTKKTIVRDLFKEMCDRLAWSVGGVDAYLLLGSVASFAAAPEVFATYSMFPGLWLHGQAESGKSTIVEWLMEVFGFSLRNGMILRGNSSSAVGLQQAADQYSNLPVWLEEFRNGEVGEDKIAVIHNGFNRGGQFKFNPSRIQRAMRTNFIVTGESTLSDPAMRGRFPHVQISERRRWGDTKQQLANYEWFQRNRKAFFIIGRWLMENRVEFARRVIENMRKWEAAGVSKRNMLAHGVAFGAWNAVAEMVGSHTEEEAAEFREWVTSHARSAAVDVRDDLNINVFWDILLAGVQAGEISKHCFNVENDLVPHAPDEPDQIQQGNGVQGWPRCKLYVSTTLLLQEMKIYLARARARLPLERSDLRDQLSKQEYWINGQHSRRFGKGMDTVKAWAFDLDKHPLGYNRVSQKEYDEFLRHPEKGDPRKGPLFYIVNWLGKDEQLGDDMEGGKK